MENRETRMRKRACWGVMFFLFLSLAVASSLWAAEGSQEEGGFFSGIKNSFSNMFSGLSSADVGAKPKIKPHFSATSGFNSNARIENKQADAAWQARVAPGLTLAVPLGDKLYSEVDYTYGFASSQGRESSFNTSTHNVNALARYDISDSTVFGASNNMQWSESPDRADKTFFLDTATGEVSHRFTEKLSTVAGYVYQYYDDPTVETTVLDNQDYSDHGVKLVVNNQVTEKLSVSPGFFWNIRNFNEAKNKDYHQYQPILAASYNLGPKTLLGGSFGWAYRDFAKGSSQHELVYGASVTHAMGRKFVWGVNYTKSLQDTFNSSFALRQDNPDAGNLDSYDTRFRVLKVHRIDSTATYNLNEKNALSAFLATQFIESDDRDNVVTGEKNDEKIMETGTRYSYRLTRYLSFDIGYTFGRRFTTQNSTQRTEYTFHKATGGVNLSF